MAFAIHWHESAMCAHVSQHPELPSHLPPYPIPLGCLSASALSAQFQALNVDWSSISHIVVYMFECYSLNSSHSCILPQSLNVCSLQLWLFCCLAYKVVTTIFQITYICVNALYWCFSFWLTSLCIMGSSFGRSLELCVCVLYVCMYVYVYIHIYILAE